MDSSQLLFNIIFRVSGFAVEVLQNTFAVVGQTSFLKCRAENGSRMVKWSFKRSNDAENISVDIYTRHGKQPKTTCQRCNVAEDQNGFNVLSFNATTMGNGGSYMCDIERDRAEVRYGAELIVFGKFILRIRFSNKSFYRF